MDALVPSKSPTADIMIPALKPYKYVAININHGVDYHLCTAKLSEFSSKALQIVECAE